MIDIGLRRAPPLLLAALFAAPALGQDAPPAPVRPFAGMAFEAGEGFRMAQAAPVPPGITQAPPVAAAPVPVAPAAPPATGTTVRLIELLIQNGVLTRDQAQALLRQAAVEAAANRPSVRAAAPPMPRPPAGLPETDPVPPGTVRVAYVPELVRQQIRDDVRRDVLAQARQEGWATPGAVAEWTQRLRMFGDLRVRGEAVTFPDGNAASFGFTNFQSINAGNGFDQNGTNQTPIPTLNVTDDRTRFRLRARLGVEAQIADWITGTIQIATGNDGSPVSTNQTFGAANVGQGQFGNFSKYNIWLDRGWVRMTPFDWLTVDVGRMPNPFVSTDLLYDIDLNFDGVAAKFRRRLARDVTGFATVGAFPYFNTDFNFGSTDADKRTSRDRYLAAVQGGIDWRISPQWGLQLAAGYYNFVNAEGKLSAPCVASRATDICSEDQSRSFFTQNTNTFFPVRNIAPSRTGSLDDPELQYYGLASRFRIVDVNARLDISRFDPYQIVLEANWLQNVGFDRRRIERSGPVSNVTERDFRFIGGELGYLLRATFGHRDAETRLWAWNLQFTYRYLESDAVLDAFTDSDFRLGGTNSKGFILGGTLGIARNTAMRARWLSGEEVSGPTYRADVFQLDLLSRF